MANIQGNRVALEDIFYHIYPAQASIELVQEQIGLSRDPYLIITATAGDPWQKIDCPGYEVLFLAGDNVQQMGGAPAYVKFGQQGPADITGTDASGGMPVLAGTKLKMPQGFRFLWFLPSSDTNWRVVITKIPCIETTYGPYAWTMPPVRMISNTLGGSTLVGFMTTPPVGGAGVIDYEGFAIPSRTKKLSIHIHELSGLTLRPLTTLTGGPLQIYWATTCDTGGVQLWQRNEADDWTTGNLGEVTVDHCVERYDVDGITRIFLYDPTGWTEASLPGVALSFDLQFFG